jgi:hypothetical protein
MHDAFARDLAEVINRHSVENVSNTPDIVLAAFLVECLDAFDVAVNERTALAAKTDERPAAEQDGDSAADRVRRTANRRLADGYKTADYDDEDVIAVLDNREAWRNLARSRGAKQAEQDGDVRAVALREFLDLHAERRGHDVIDVIAVGDGRTVELTRSGLNRLLDENRRLRETTTRTADSLVLVPKDQCGALLAYDRTVIRCERIGDHWPALHTARFGDGARVEWRDPEPSIEAEADAALDARDADGSAS